MSKYAIFDPATPDPSPVVGWVDTDVFHYPYLPPQDSRLALTDQQWSTRMQGRQAVSGGGLVAYSAPATNAPDWWPVPKYLLIERLIEAGKLRGFRKELCLDAAVDGMADRDLVARTRFEAAATLHSNDPVLRAALIAAGAAPDAMLARP